jgi:hypothetical protein
MAESKHRAMFPHWHFPQFDDNQRIQTDLLGLDSTAGTVSKERRMRRSQATLSCAADALRETSRKREQSVKFEHSFYHVLDVQLPFHVVEVSFCFTAVMSSRK